MRRLNTKIIAILLLLAVSGVLPAAAQSFEKVELLVPNGKKVDERSVIVSFTADSLVIETTGAVKISKSFKYSDIRNAEYSYTKNPRWKTGLGLGVASLAFPPLLFVALPMAFSKHRRHWLTIRTETDFAVLKLSKSNRKVIIPTFETRSGVRISGEGEEK
jgi:hypothetical protein